MKLVNDWWLPDDDSYFSEVLRKTNSPFQIERLRQALEFVPNSSRMLAVDVGAHVGMWACELALTFSCVYAFEPVMDTYACLERNVAAKGRGNVFTKALAVGDKAALVRVCVDSSRPGNSGSNYIEAMQDDEGKGVSSSAEIVCQIKLDEMNLPRLDFLKLDAEGAEPLILLGASDTIMRYKPVIYVEAKKGFGKRFGVKDGAALDILREWGAKEVLHFRSSDYVFTFS